MFVCLLLLHRSSICIVYGISCRSPEIKEVKLRPVTEKADYDTKVKQAQKFLSKGAKVKLTMTFSGREMRFKDQGKEMMLVSCGIDGKDGAAAATDVI